MPSPCFYVTLIKGNSAGRFKAFYYYNTPAVFDVIMEMFMPLIKKKFKDRVKYVLKLIKITCALEKILYHVHRRRQAWAEEGHAPLALKFFHFDH